MLSTKERDDILIRFRNNKIKAIVNVGVLTTGFDYPELDTIILARPTMSLALYYQMIGRSIRPWKGKDYSLVIDLTDNHKRFGKIKDIKLHVNDKTPFISSNNRQLTNVYFRENGETERDRIPNDSLNSYLNSSVICIESKRLRL